MKTTITILFFILLSLPIFAGVTKADADALYKKEQYQKAAEVYEQILEKQGVAAEIYYNLGGCYYKTGNIPLAILNYERALRLSPGDADIRANLALARGKTIDKVTPSSQMFFVTWWFNIVYSMSMNAWAYLAIAIFIFSLLSLLLYFFSTNISLQKGSFSFSLLLFFVVIIANLAAYSQHLQNVEHTGAIVMAETVSVKSSPSDTSTDLFIIHEGSKVEILDKSMKEWCEVKFEEGKQGWIPNSSIEEI